MSEQKPKRAIGVNEILTMKVYQGDIEALLHVLDFAKRASMVLAHQEMTKGSGITGAAKMNRIARDAEDLAIMFAKTIDIGEPPTDTIN